MIAKFQARQAPDSESQIEQELDADGKDRPDATS